MKTGGMKNFVEKKQLDNKETQQSLFDKSFIGVFITTFFTVFLAELGDKTQIATLLLSAQSGRPIIVFVGAGSALICSSLVGVILGRWLSDKLPPERFSYIAGILLIILGLWIGIQVTLTFIQNSPTL